MNFCMKWWNFVWMQNYFASKNNGCILCVFMWCCVWCVCVCVCVCVCICVRMIKHVLDYWFIDLLIPKTFKFVCMKAYAKGSSCVHVNVMNFSLWESWEILILNGDDATHRIHRKDICALLHQLLDCSYVSVLACLVERCYTSLQHIEISIVKIVWVSPDVCVWSTWWCTQSISRSGKGKMRKFSGMGISERASASCCTRRQSQVLSLMMRRQFHT